MGLKVHSLNNIPKTENRDFFIYLLDYGWHEPLAESLRNNFDFMARKAATSRAVVIQGTEIGHFENEVFSWHGINGLDGDVCLPAILITNMHPSDFKDQSFRSRRRFGLNIDENTNLKLILIPLKKVCESTIDVATLIEKIFLDIEHGEDLVNFKVTNELKGGTGKAILDALIIEPNFNGIGFNFRKFFNSIKNQ
ncbi:hypothetical protein ACX1N5_00760 [Acinetobacter sp. ANC 4636]